MNNEDFSKKSINELIDISDKQILEKQLKTEMLIDELIKRFPDQPDIVCHFEKIKHWENQITDLHMNVKKTFKIIHNRLAELKKRAED